MATRLIIALDFNNQSDTFALLDKLDPQLCAIKIGIELFTLFGAELVKSIILRQFKVFLDLKFHDIPNTVARACAASAELGVWMLNVHACGGIAMMQAARQAIERFGNDKPLLIAVTVLTSFAAPDLLELGIVRTLSDEVNHLAKLAQNTGLDGVVCSAHETALVKHQCGHEFLTVTPGIRLDKNQSDDQSRIMTPMQARLEGSDYIVVGRAITHALNPELVMTAILKDLS